ncbi:MAG: 6-phosphofructokinase [Armatimonadetes bacterium RBG_16_67_12]|nr:MAG: 6-phosphofructokinase [Armatimonadetes bacterium RBG_16_67_12]
MAANRRKRIAILTGGGDCAGLNAVIRAVVLSAVGGYGWEVLGIEDGFDGFLHDRMRPLDLDDVRGILTLGGTILGTTNRGNPFAWPVIRDGQPQAVDASREVLQRLETLHLDALLVIGGDGTLHIADALHRMNAPIVGIPKTIDNDISATDVTFGFDTARLTATEAIDKLHTTAESHHRIMVVETMGRNAGWIALESGIAGGANSVLIPEIAYQIESVVRSVEERAARGRRFSIVVAAEGAYPVGGAQVYREPGTPGKLPRLGGIGQQVADALAEATGRETRCTVLGHLQRGGSPTPFDRLLATRFGVRAVECVADGELGLMVALRGTEVLAVPLAEAIVEPKRVLPGSELVRAARDLGISLGDEP